MDTPMPEGVKNLVVMNVNEVEKVAATVDFVFSAVDMSKKRSRRSKKNMLRQRHGCFQQQCSQMDTGCTDGSAGNQSGTLRCNRIPEETSWNNTRIYRC